MSKRWIAILAAFVTTLCVAIPMFVVGGAALLNKNGVPASNSASQVSLVSNTQGGQQDKVAQLESLVAQYQDREKQYQQREQQLQDQVSQANQQLQQDQQMIQQVQMLLSALQQRGLITVTGDGRIFINN